MHLNEGIKEECVKVTEAEGVSLTEGVGLDNTDVNLIEGGKLKEESVKKLICTRTMQRRCWTAIIRW